MLEEQSGSESQENVEQNVQTDTQDSGQNLTDTLNQEKAYSQKPISFLTTDYMLERANEIKKAIGN